MSLINKNLKYLPYIYFIILVLLILAPVLKPGFILSLDHVFTPIFKKPDLPAGEFYLVSWFFYLVSKIIPSFILEKIWLFLILFLVALGSFRLLPTKSIFPKIFAGTFYLFNPFIYDRLLSGQWRLLTSYALLPFLFKILFEFKKEPDFKKTLEIILLLSLISIFHLRTLTVVLVIFAIYILLIISQNLKNKEYLISFFKQIVLIGAGFFILNFYWIVSLFRHSNDLRFNVDSSQIFAFQTVADQKLGLFFNIFSLYGFWGEKGFHYQNLKDLVFGWQFLIVLIWILVTLGIFGGLRQKKIRDEVLILLILIPIAAIFSAGVAFKPLEIVHLFLEKNFFIFKGLRENQKFSEVLVLAFVYFGGWGLQFILEIFKKEKFFKAGFAAVAIALPLFYSSGLIWAAKGQIKTYQYPKSWYSVNQTLNFDQENFKILFLPWHRYLSFGFTDGKIIDNPAPIFFNQEIISADNLEFGQIYSQSQNPTSKFIEREIVDFKGGEVSEKLNRLCVKYIILAKEVDFEKYQFIDGELTKKLETAELTLYQNQKFNCQVLTP